MASKLTGLFLPFLSPRRLEVIGARRPPRAASTGRGRDPKMMAAAAAAGGQDIWIWVEEERKGR